MKYALLILLTGIAGVCSAQEAKAPAAVDPAQTTAVTAYLSSHAIPLKSVEAGNGFEDLKPLETVLKDVRLVGLGEATHGTREFFQFKHRMLEFLVERMGFNIFAIESSYVGCMDINDYVMYGKGDPEKALTGQGFWTWNTNEVAEMIQWMRQYNSRLPEAKRIRFMGFDIQTYGQAFGRISGYLQRVAPEYLPQAQEAFKPLQAPESSRGRSAEQIAADAARLQALMDFLTGHRAALVKQSSEEEFDQMLQHARVLYQNHQSYSKVGKELPVMYRDQAMAQNIRYLMDKFGPQTKMVVWAHNGHVADLPKTPEKLSSMGHVLRQWYGRDYYIMGFTFNEGSFQSMGLNERKLTEFTLPPAPEGTLPWYFDRARQGRGYSDYLVDLRSAPANGPVADWLSATQRMPGVGSVFSPSMKFELYMRQSAVGKEYDGMVFIGKTTRARPNASSRPIVAAVVANALLAQASGSPSAPPSGAPEQVTVRIEARALEDGLNEFARQTGLQVIFRSEQAQGLRVPAVVGTFSPQVALDRLLSQSSLSYRFVNARTIAIESARPTTQTSESAGSIALVRAEGADPGAAQPEPRKGTATESSANEVTVTGTRETGVINQGVIPREENQAVRYTIIRREDIERAGVTTMPELMRRLASANQSAGVTTQSNYNISFSRITDMLGASDQANLRGLGTNQTLIMINGRRLFGSDGATGPDLGRIPLAAVERVEILPSSGSAIYGANSVGGVINIVMRQGYRGTEVGSYLGTSSGGGAGEARFDLFHGTSFNDQRTSMTVSLELQTYEDLTRGERDYDARLLASRYAQPGSPGFLSLVLPAFTSQRATVYTDSTLGLGVPSNPTARYAAVPVGSNGIGLVPSSFSGTANTAHVSAERLGRARLRQQSQNYGAMLNLGQQIFGSALEAYAELTWREETAGFDFPAPFAVTLTATDARNPFRTGVTPGFVGRAITIYRDAADLPDSNQSGERRTARAVAGVKGKWAFDSGRSYSWALDASWDRNLNSSASTYYLGVDRPSQLGLYNILRDLTGASLLPQSELEKYRRLNIVETRPTIGAANLRLNGDLFELWGGPAKFSFGSEARRETYDQSSVTPYFGEYTCSTFPNCFGPVVTHFDRRVFAAYTEVVLPLVGAKNRPRWLYSAELSAGMRFEKYTDFSAAKPPLVAAKIGLTRDIALRASFAEGFQPPTVLQLQQPLIVAMASGGYQDPLRPGATNPNFTYIREGNPNLRPETSDTWDAGFILTPRVLPGFTLNASYFRYDKKDNIVSNALTQPYITQVILFFPDMYERAPQSAADIAANRPGPMSVLNAVPFNLARQFTDGVDVNLRYNLPAWGHGQFTLLSSGTWTKRFSNQARPDVAPLDSLALGAATLDKRGSFTLLWDRDAWSASLAGNYVGPFETGTTAPNPRNPNGTGVDGPEISSQLTFDLQLQYTVARAGETASGMREWLGGTRFIVGALNLFDTPPALWSNLLSGYVSPYVDPRQRFIYLQARKTF